MTKFLVNVRELYDIITIGIFPKINKKNKIKKKLCIVGNPDRRNMDIINKCLITKEIEIIIIYRSKDSKIKLPNCSNIIDKRDINDLEIYNELNNCDYILLSVDPESNKEYFGKSNDILLSGTFAWALVLDKPVIGHSEIMDIYNFKGIKYNNADDLINIINYQI